jgi:hypothetical protein
MDVDPVEVASVDAEVLVLSAHGLTLIGRDTHRSVD